MKRKVKICLIIAVIVILLINGIIFYFYFFHTFHKLRICISNEIEDSTLLCADQQECIDFLMEEIDRQKAFENSPDFVKDKILSLIDRIVLCEHTCKIKEIYGSGFGGVGEVKACKPGEEEIVFEIKGKEGIEILRYMKENKLI